MTTIAYDGKHLVTDSLMSSGDMVFGSTAKVFKLKDGRHVALCGDVGLTVGILDWLNGGEKPDLAPDESVAGIVVDKKGKASEFGKPLRLFPTCIPWAGGSGEVIAMTAMRCGKTAAEAVAMACELDKHSRLPLQIVKIC